VIRITFVGIPHTGAEWLVALLTCVGSGFRLSFERAAELLAASELKNIVGDRGSVRATLGSRLDVDIRHGTLSLTSRDEIWIHWRLRCSGDNLQ
jgi:hypothetical protein